MILSCQVGVVVMLASVIPGRDSLKWDLWVTIYSISQWINEVDLLSYDWAVCVYIVCMYLYYFCIAFGHGACVYVCVLVHNTFQCVCVCVRALVCISFFCVCMCTCLFSLIFRSESYNQRALRIVSLGVSYTTICVRNLDVISWLGLRL